jgi:hypothetical protein
MSELATRQDIDEAIGILHAFIDQVDNNLTNVEKQTNERFNQQDGKYDCSINDL